MNPRHLRAGVYDIDATWVRSRQSIVKTTAFLHATVPPPPPPLSQRPRRRLLAPILYFILTYQVVLTVYTIHRLDRELCAPRGTSQHNLRYNKL